MDAQSGSIQVAAEADPWRLLYRAGALSALVFVILILVPLVLLIVQPQVPVSGGAAILEYIGAHRAVYLAELLCFVGLSLPALLVFLALGIALSRSNRSLAAMGALVGAASEIIALALGTSPPSLGGGLLVLSRQYVTAGEAARPALAAAAEALAASANAVTAAGILTALGILLLSLAMAKAGFGRGRAILGIVTGALGIVLEALRPLVGMAYSLYGLLLPLWFVAAGLGLLRLARAGGGGRRHIQGAR
jgi:hypothetical protein